MDMGHVNRDGRHFPTPPPPFSPPLLPLTPSSWCIQPEGEEGGERHGLHCDLQPPPPLQLQLPCICPLTAGIQPDPDFHFRFQISLLCENFQLTLGWSEYIQESGQLPIGGDLAEYRRAIAVSTEGNFWAIFPAAVCRRSLNLTPC